MGNGGIEYEMTKHVFKSVFGKRGVKVTIWKCEWSWGEKFRSVAKSKTIWYNGNDEDFEKDCQKVMPEMEAYLSEHKRQSDIYNQKLLDGYKQEENERKKLIDLCRYKNV